MNNKLAKVLRVIAIVLLGITAAVTILSGVGTICVAFNAEKFDSMAAIVPYKPLYQLFVVLTTAVGIAAVVSMVAFIRGKRWSYLGTLLILIAGIIVGGVHMYFSTMLRGSSMPADARVYASVLTLIVFLLLRIPGIWQGINFESGEDASGSGKTTAGLAIMVGGLVTVSSPIWATPTHIFDGRNWAHFIDLPLIGGGLILMICGAALIVSRYHRKPVIARSSRSEHEGAVATAAR